MYLFSLGSESPKGAIGHIMPTEKTILAVEKNKLLLPPLWNRTFSWGFDDLSCCLGNYGSDKVSGSRVATEPGPPSGWGRGGQEVGEPEADTATCTSMWLCLWLGSEGACVTC